MWESNPPSTPRRDGSPALKTGRITGPLAPPYQDKRMIPPSLAISPRSDLYDLGVLGVSSGANCSCTELLLHQVEYGFVVLHPLA